MMAHFFRLICSWLILTAALASACLSDSSESFDISVSNFFCTAGVSRLSTLLLATLQQSALWKKARFLSFVFLSSCKGHFLLIFSSSCSHLWIFSLSLYLVKFLRICCSVSLMISIKSTWLPTSLKNFKAAFQVFMNLSYSALAFEIFGPLKLFSVMCAQPLVLV